MLAGASFTQYAGPTGGTYRGSVRVLSNPSVRAQATIAPPIRTPSASDSDLSVRSGPAGDACLNQGIGKPGKRCTGRRKRLAQEGVDDHPLGGNGRDRRVDVGTVVGLGKLRKAGHQPRERHHPGRAGREPRVERRGHVAHEPRGDRRGQPFHADGTVHRVHPLRHHAGVGVGRSGAGSGQYGREKRGLQWKSLGTHWGGLRRGECTTGGRLGTAKGLGMNRHRSAGYQLFVREPRSWRPRALRPSIARNSPQPSPRTKTR